MKILVFDIESTPLTSYTWGLRDQNVALNQIKSDWHLLSFAAKWLGKKKIIYHDQRDAKPIHNDKAILKILWKLLNEAEVVVTQNGQRFDSKKVNARFVINGMKPPSPYRHIDTLTLAKRHFAFTSNKLEYMAGKLCLNKKLKPKKFQGFELWAACMAGNKSAWNELRLYNIADIVATEELYNILSPWGHGVDFNSMRKTHGYVCNCGSSDTVARGFRYNKTGKFRQYACKNCGAWSVGRENLLPKAKRKEMRR